jgi:hypothetical protein
VADLGFALQNGISMLDEAALYLAVDETLRVRYIVKGLLELAAEPSNLVLIRG